MKHDIRWKQRFENFNRAILLLREPFDQGIDTLSELEKEGTIQRFEVALELAWNTLNDYLKLEGQIVNPVTPRNVFKEAFAAGILSDGQVWMDMLEHRNLLTHTYSSTIFEMAVIAIQDRYLEALNELHAWFGQLL